MNCLNLKQQISRIESADFNDARVLQASMAKSISLQDEWADIDGVAGLDVGFEEDNSIAIGGIVVLSYPDFDVIE